MENMYPEEVRHYISLLQENINRMANNSANCKTWLTTLVAAMLALQISLGELKSILWIILIPIVLFYVLDSYYLGLEKRFRDIEGDFVNKLPNDDKDISYKELLYNFNVSVYGNDFVAIKYGLKSTSTWPFYGVLFVIVAAISAYPYISTLL